MPGPKSGQAGPAPGEMERKEYPGPLQPGWVDLPLQAPPLSRNFLSPKEPLDLTPPCRHSPCPGSVSASPDWTIFAASFQGSCSSVPPSTPIPVTSFYYTEIIEFPASAENSVPTLLRILHCLPSTWGESLNCLAWYLKPFNIWPLYPLLIQFWSNPILRYRLCGLS